MIVVGSAVPALLWGVAFANIVQGVPLDADHNYTGTLLRPAEPVRAARRTHHAAALLHPRRGVRLAEDRGRPARAGAAARRAVGRSSRSSSRPRSWSGPGSRSARRGSGSSPRSRPSRSSAAGSPTGAARRARAFTLLAVDRRGGRVRAVRVAVPRRDAGLERPGEQPHRSPTRRAPTYTLTVMSWLALVALPLVLLYQGWTYWVFRKRVTRAHHRGGSALIT